MQAQLRQDLRLSLCNSRYRQAWQQCSVSAGGGATNVEFWGSVQTGHSPIPPHGTCSGTSFSHPQLQFKICKEVNTEYQRWKYREAFLFFAVISARRHRRRAADKGDIWVMVKKQRGTAFTHSHLSGKTTNEMISAHLPQRVLWYRTQ